jgi:hypothetical protein
MTTDNSAQNSRDAEGTERAQREYRRDDPRRPFGSSAVQPRGLQHIPGSEYSIAEKKKSVNTVAIIRP